MNEQDLQLMALAIEEAGKCPAEGPHVPRVGAVVLTRDGRVTTAHRSEYELGQHAEFTALELKLADATLAGATVYTTLEPCTKRGVTKDGAQKIACADRLISRKVQRVVIGMLDPNPDISGKGQMRLREARISTELFPDKFAAEVEELNREFIHRHRTIHPTLLQARNLADSCATDGLVHLEFRDSINRRLPPAAIYDSARTEILLMGVSLATSLNPHSPNETLDALRRANDRGVKLHFLLFDPESPPNFVFSEVCDDIRRSIRWIREAVEAGSLRGDGVQLRVINHWPHFTGVLIDGDVSGPVRGNLRASIATPANLLLRVQPVIPPEGDQAQHFAPVFQYQGKATDTICAYVRGFRHYWAHSRPVSVTG